MTSKYLVAMAIEHFPEEMQKATAGSNLEDLARELLCKIPLPHVDGFLLGGVASGRGAIHRRCFAQSNNVLISKGEERIRWIQLITDWPHWLRCGICKQATAPE